MPGIGLRAEGGACSTHVHPDQSVPLPDKEWLEIPGILVQVVSLEEPLEGSPQFHRPPIAGLQEQCRYLSSGWQVARKNNLNRQSNAISQVQVERLGGAATEFNRW